MGFCYVFIDLRFGATILIPTCTSILAWQKSYMKVIEPLQNSCLYTIAELRIVRPDSSGNLVRAQVVYHFLIVNEESLGHDLIQFTAYMYLTFPEI